MTTNSWDVVALGGAAAAVLLAGAALWHARGAWQEADRLRAEMDRRLRALDHQLRESLRPPFKPHPPAPAMPPASSGTIQAFGERREVPGPATGSPPPVLASSVGDMEPPTLAPPTLRVRIHLPVDEARAREIFDRWCGGVRGPELLEDVEVVAMSFNSSEVDSIGKVLRHLLRESPQVSHFVRIGTPGAAEAYLFPHPDAAFSPFIQSVFRGATAEAFKSPGLLSGTRPLTARRLEGQAGVWEVPCRD